MQNYTFIFLILFMSCSPTEPVETYDDASVLQDFIDNSPDLIMSLDLDSSGVIEPMELGDQNWDNGRINSLVCNNIGVSGEIPENIGKLTQLRTLVLKSNNLEGEIPSSIGNLLNLKQLNLSQNTLSGSMPDTIGNLKNLIFLDISHNELTGSIPKSIGKLLVLETFAVDSNQLSGSIPDEICNVYKTKYDYLLSGNQFCQSLPICLDEREKIGYQNCDTSCGTEYKFIDGYCYYQTDLNVLQTIIDSSLATNPNSINMIMDLDTSQVIEPLELGYQEWSTGRLVTLDCYWDPFSCNLSITIPDNIDELDSLKVLYLKKNNLSGVIPEEIGNLTALENLNLEFNSLSGKLPETILNLTNLKEISINNNQLSGEISESICTQFSGIETLNFVENKFCPCYPQCFIESYAATQDTTECSYCSEGYRQVCDKQSESITIEEGDSLCFKSDNLEVLKAFIDSSLDNRRDLLDTSMLSDSTDSIDDLKHIELGEQIWANGKLISFDAKNRGLSGGIPQNIGNLDSLFYLYISDNQLNGELPEGIYNFLKVNQTLQSLHISGNQLSGEIEPAACLMLDNWETDGFDPTKSYLDDNQFCPSEEGYPECIKDYVGEQDTTTCNSPTP